MCDDAIGLCVILNAKKNRLDKFLASELRFLSRTKIQDLIAEGFVQVNGIPEIRENFSLKPRDEILLIPHLATQENSLIPDENVKFSINYEDESILVIDKPAGVVVHPGAGNFSGTLVHGLLSHCDSLSSGSEISRPGIVHRIDKDTSGILVIAKNDFVHQKLAQQFAEHSIRRKYVCFCYGILQPERGRMETLISRDKNNRLRMAVSKNSGKKAITIYNTLEKFGKFVSKVECELKTGRTHQIRVHLSHLGHSLIGDKLYKFKNYALPTENRDLIENFPRQALHAFFLEFQHPVSGKILTFTSEIPKDMKELERRLRMQSRFVENQI